MTLRKNSKKKKEIKLIKIAGEHWQHREHRTIKRKKNAENSIEKKKLLEKIITNEQKKEINKLKHNS